MLTEIQKIILPCLLGPEDPGAWKRERNRESRIKCDAKDPDRRKKQVRGAMRRFRAKDPKKVRETNRLQKRSSRATQLGRDQEARNKKTYRTRHPERCRDSWKKQYDTKPSFHLAQNIRCGIRRVLKGLVKSGKTEKLIGCSFAQLKIHLESLFRPGMAWENYGPVWHVDHIKPCAKFDLTDPAQQKICFHWTNLQPLFAEENLRKGARI